MRSTRQKRGFGTTNTTVKSQVTPDLTKPRKWLILDYNPTTNTYILTSEEDNYLIWSCLSCKTKLQENSHYIGYKNIKTKELVLVDPHSTVQDCT